MMSKKEKKKRVGGGAHGDWAINKVAGGLVGGGLGLEGTPQIVADPRKSSQMVGEEGGGDHGDGLRGERVP